MSVERVKKFLSGFGRDGDVLEMDTSTATVQLAADALGIIPARIAKTLALKGTNADNNIILVAAGDARLDNKKFREEFGVKPGMLSPELTAEVTGYAVGGVCPFDLSAENKIMALDESLKRFITVYPACGSSNSAIELTLDELEQYSHITRWVDVCKDWNPDLT